MGTQPGNNGTLSFYGGTEMTSQDELVVAYIQKRAGEVDRPDALGLEAEAVRGIAEIKAEALREAAAQIRHKQHPESVRQMLRRRADRIEQEDSNE